MPKPIGNSMHSPLRVACAAGRVCRVVALVLVACALGLPARAQQDSLPAIDLDEVWRLAEAKRFDSAAALLRDHLAKVPSDAESRSILARVLSWGRHYPESIAE